MRLSFRTLGVALALLMAVGAAAIVALRLREPARGPVSSAARPGIPPVGPAVALADGLYLVPGGGGNTAVFITAAGVVVVDPKYATAWPALEAQIRALTSQPITHVILTHAHPDHAGAVEVLPADVEVIGHLQTIRRVIDFGWLQRRGATPNVRVFADRVTLFTGADTITLVSHGPAHTDGDALVVFHAARVLHAGDLFPDTVAPIANIEGGGDGVGLARTLTAAAAGIHDVDRVITGHGTVMTWHDFTTFAGFVQMLVDYVRAEMGFRSDKNAVFRAISIPDRYSSYHLDRLFNTLDEIDRSIRPRWQRIF